MQLWQLGLMVASGVALIVFLVHATGGSKVAALSSADAAQQRFADDFPTVATGPVIMTQTSNAAFLPLDDGRTGLVHAIGDSFLTRLLEPGSVVQAKASGARLDLRFADFTFPGAAYDFADAQTAALVAARLAPAKDSIHA